MRKLRTVRGEETCEAQAFEKSEPYAWSCDSRYFDFNRKFRSRSVRWAVENNLTMLLSEGETWQDAREKYRVGMRNDRAEIVEIIGDGKFIRIRCDCGNEKIIRSRSWAQTRSCGCKTAIAKGARQVADAIGKRFGNLTVLRVADELKGYSREKRVICRCEKCGGIGDYSWDNVKRGASTQCRDCANKEAGEARSRHLADAIGKPFKGSPDYVVVGVEREQRASKNCKGKPITRTKTFFRVRCQMCGKERLVNPGGKSGLVCGTCRQAELIANMVAARRAKKAGEIVIATYRRNAE